MIFNPPNSYSKEKAFLILEQGDPNFEKIRQCFLSEELDLFETSTPNKYEVRIKESMGFFTKLFIKLVSEETYICVCVDEAMNRLG